MSESLAAGALEHGGERILLVEDDQGLVHMLCEELEENGYQVRPVSSAEEAGELVKAWEPDLVVSDLKLPGADGMALLESVKELYLQPGFLIITAFGSIAQAVEALKSGADDFLAKPLDLEHFSLSVKRILRHRRLQQEVHRFRSLMARDAFQGMIGRSRKMRIMFDQLQEIARAQGPVLIQGESGVGKELAAKALHDLSPRRRSRFLAVNCAGIPSELLESEFFGHEEGAFTGAVKKRQGLFHRTHTGSLMLDEIGEMPYNLQSKLLRVLQDGSFRPVGSNKEQQVDVRIIGSTNQDLDRLIASGGFREDLFYRLETFSLTVPPLRERREDIPLLAAYFLNQYCLQTGKEIQGFSPEAMDRLLAYPFPGNVRELQNIIERSVTFCHARHLEMEHLPTKVRHGAGDSLPGGNLHVEPMLERLLDRHEMLPTLQEIEKQYIDYVLDKTGGNKRRAAGVLGVSRKTLYRHLGG